MPSKTSMIFPNLRAQERGRVTFSRAELGHILNVYSTRVAMGEWKDYAIDHVPGLAVFSMFRHTLERPSFSVVKYRSGSHSYEYAIFQGPALLKRSPLLPDALRVLERRIKLVVGN